MATPSALYPLVRALLLEASVLGPDDVSLSEADCVRRLSRAVRHTPELQVYSGLFPATTFDEAMLPLISRALGRTIGVVDKDDDVVPVPHQWFAPATHEVSADTDNDLYSLDDDSVDVFRRTGQGVYEQDVDDEYVSKYEAYIQSRGWSFTTDACTVPHLRGTFEGDTTSTTGSSGTKGSRGPTNTSLSDKSVTGRVLRHDQKGVVLYDIWGATRPFRAVETSGEGTRAALLPPFPAVTDPAFHPKLYRCRGLRPSDVGARATGADDDPSVVTLRDHQQIVRNVMSPVTPYHSLLLVHATGTGKTMTALGIAEVFRDYVHLQHKQIHIACPRDEVGREFKKYLASLTGAAAYIRQPYENEAVAARNDLAKPLRPGYTYRIENHGSIFPRDVRQTVGHIYRLVEAWRRVCPSGTEMRRCTTDDGITPCFRLHHPDPLSDAHVSALRAGLRNAQRQIAPYLGDAHDDAFEATFAHNDAKRGLVVFVTGLEAMVAFERQVVDTYANTLFIVDEAHNFPTDSKGANASDDDEDPHNANWRTTLLAVIGMLHAHQERMRLVLLTATPMTNSETDLSVLLNLLIRNDGLQGETILSENTKHGTLLTEHQTRLQQCIRTRVSWFESEANKPVRLLADQLWYNVPSVLAHTAGFTVVEGAETGTRVVCAPGVSAKALVEAFAAPDTTAARASPVTVRVRATTLDTHQAVAAYRRSVHDAPEATRRHVFVVFLAVPHTATLAALAAFAQRWQPGVDVVHLLSTDLEVAREVVDLEDLRTALYTAASEHRPLWFPPPAHCPVSCYRTRDPPQVYASDAGNLPRFFRTYLGIKATAATCRHDFGIVATPIQNDAIAPGVTHQKGRGVPYAFAKTVRNTWNLHDPDDVAYHPKIDTMLDLMEHHAGNVFIYTPEPRIHPTAHYARFLVFLKRIVERRFRSDKRSRLHQVHVEVLHKGTIPYLNKHLREAKSREDTPKKRQTKDFLPTELNERVKRLNETLLSTREDVVLIGSQEVMEGLQLNEVRQVHILDPLWHMAAMEQVMGRAIRFRSHLRRPKAEHNVVCFLHVTVPEDPTDARFARASTAARGARIPPMVRYVGDLHAYYRVHKKVGGIAQVQQLVRTDALDAVYRTWQPSYTPKVTVVRTARRQTKGQHKGRPQPKGIPSTDAWHVHTDLVRAEQRQWYDLMQARRQKYGLTKPNDAMSTHGASRAVATLPLPRHALQTEIDWYVRQIVRLFEKARVPAFTFEEIMRQLRPYGPAQALVTQPLPVAVHVERVHRRLIAQTTTTLPPTMSLAQLLDHTATEAPKEHTRLMALARYSQFKWHTEPVADGFVLRVDAASVAAQLATCRDVLPKVVAKWRSQGHLPLDVQADTKLRAAIGALPLSLRASTLDLCTPKRLVTTDTPMLQRHFAPPAATGTLRRTASTTGATGTRRRSAKATTLTDLRVLNIHPEAVAYALEDVVRQRRCIEHHAGQPCALALDEARGLYALEPLAVPRPTTVWHTPDASGVVRSLQTLPYSTPLPTTTVVTDDVLREVATDVHRVAEWLRARAAEPGVARTPLGRGLTTANDALAHSADVWSAAIAFDAVPFEYQDALLRFAAVYGFDASTESAHPLLKDPTTRTALATVKQGAGHRFAEKPLGNTGVFPAAATTIMQDTFGKAVQARAFATYPRNPATETCAVHVYTQTRHTGKATVKPFALYTLDAAGTSRWTTHYCPVPIVLTDVDVHARFYPSTDARLTTSSQPPITGPTRFVGYGEVLNYKDQAARGFVYKFVDATRCESTEKAGLPLTDAQFVERVRANGDELYPAWETAWTGACRKTPPPETRYCQVDPVCVARMMYLQARRAYLRYFFPGVQPQHPRTKQLYAGWRARKKT